MDQNLLKTSCLNVINDSTGEEILEKMIIESMLIREEEDILLENKVPVCGIGVEKDFGISLLSKTPFDISKPKLSVRL